PSIERLLTRPLALTLAPELGRERLRDLLREITDEIRTRAGREQSIDDDAEADLIAEIERELELRAIRAARPSLRRVVNATGVVLHTNLGRSPLPKAAIDAIAEVAAHYSNLEYDLESGARGRRETHCQELLARVAGAQAAVVANNNAAAVMLVLNTLAGGGEVIVSRGELIEIGGSFRIPDVMEKSGARLVEGGATNRTCIPGSARGVTQRPPLILAVLPANDSTIRAT